MPLLIKPYRYFSSIIIVYLIFFLKIAFHTTYYNVASVLYIKELFNYIYISVSYKCIIKEHYLSTERALKNLKEITNYEQFRNSRRINRY